MGAFCGGGGGSGAASSKAVPPAQMNVFWSGHLTDGHEQRRVKWLSDESKDPDFKEEKASIKASAPPFNVAKKDIPVPGYVMQVNAPAFGPNIANAVMQIFMDPKLKEIATDLGVPIPSYVLSKFVQEKMPKVHDMIKYCKEDKSLEGSKACVDKLEAFTTEFESLSKDTITDLAAWKAFVKKHVKEDGWESKLHFDHLLSHFGFDEATSKRLRDVKFKKPDGEEVTFEQHAFRWLSKAFSAYGPEGALTDVVNLTFAMTRDEGYKDLSDTDIAKKIEDFGKKALAKNVKGMWLPSHFFMDAEGDDCMVWVLLKYCNPNLKVLIQLADGDDDLKPLEEKFKLLPGVTVWRDPDARNAKAVKTCFKSFLK